MRTQRSLLNFAAGLASTALVLIVGLVATPFLLRWLGEDRFGAFRVTLDWFGYLALFELGLGEALWPLLARAAGRGDTKSVEHTLAAGIRAYLHVSLAKVLVGAGLTAAIVWLVPVGPELQADLRLASLVALIGVFISPLIPFRAVLEASQLGYRIHATLSIQYLVITALSLFLARAGWGITGQSISLVAGTLLSHAFFALEGLRRHPALLARVLKERPDAGTWTEIWKLNIPSWTINISGRISLMTDNIVVALILHPGRVVPFFITQRLILLAQARLQGIGDASWAALAELHAQGKRELFTQRVIELTGIVSVLGIAALVPIAAYNERFITLWVGSARYGGDLVTFVALADALLLAVFSLWSWCFTATGEIRKLSAAALVMAAINFAFSVTFTYAFGLAGPLLGTLLAYLSINTWFLPRALSHTFDIPVGKLLMAVALPWLAGLPYATAVWWVAHQHVSSLARTWEWIRLATEMSASAAVFLGFAWISLLSQGERDLWKQRFGEIRRMLVSEQAFLH